MTGAALDVHQHLWPEELLDRLRARTRPPFLRGWTLVLDGEPDHVVRPEDHEPGRRVAADAADGIGQAVVSLSAPLGIESLPPPQARPLLRAWHDGVEALPDHFRAWASVSEAEPDLDGLRELLARPRFAGVQLPATQLLTPTAWEQAGPVLATAEAAGLPVLVHPGPQPRPPAGARLPDWWAPVVGYSAQLQAAWWAWHAAGGRQDFPRLRLVFAAGAGLAPLLQERHALRGGGRTTVDPLVHVDTSGHGTRALDSLLRVLGVDALVLGSDRPYATPLAHLLDPAATRAVRETNPRRLLGSPDPILTHPERSEGETPWTPTVLVS